MAGETPNGVDPSSSPAKKPLYEASTQFRSWRYSPEQLRQVRQKLNVGAVAAIRKTIEENESGSSASLSFLQPDDELVLVKLYITKIPQLCGHFRFPEEVEATAISYLKRFYLKNTVMDWHPKNVMLTALFLATKTTNNPISLDSYTSNIPKTSQSDVLGLEFLVAQSLNFEFAVWHAHRALWGLWLDLQGLPDLTEALRTPEVYETALKHVRASRFTDAELIYTPSQIAIASLSLASPLLSNKWMDSKLPSDAAAAESYRQTLERSNSTIGEMILRDAQPPNVEAAREVDRCLKLCKNPQRVVGSKAYLARRAEEERRAEEKRNKKAHDFHKTIEGDDPFGSELVQIGQETQDMDDDD
ncbi:cyclin-like protein [Scleroderma yunnanense]